MTQKELFYNKHLEKRVLKPFKIENKVFYPIINILTSDIGNKYYSTIISPIAFIIEEYGEKYVIHLNNDDTDDNELFSLMASK